MIGLPCLPRGSFLSTNVRVILPHVHQERALPIRLDEPDGLVGQAVGDVLPLRPAGDVARLEPVGRVVARGTRIGRPVKLDVEPLLVRPVPRFEPQVPFAKVSRTVAGGLEGFGHRHLLQGQEVAADGEDPLLVRADAGRIGQRSFRPGRLMPGGGCDADSSGILPGHNARPGGAAERIGRVGVGEPHPASGQPVDIRRFVVLAPVDAAVHPAHVVDEEEDDIGTIDRETLACAKPCNRQQNHRNDGRNNRTRRGTHLQTPGIRPTRTVGVQASAC